MTLAIHSVVGRALGYINNDLLGKKDVVAKE